MWRHITSAHACVLLPADTAAGATFSHVNVTSACDCATEGKANQDGTMFAHADTCSHAAHKGLLTCWLLAWRPCCSFLTDPACTLPSAQRKTKCDVTGQVDLREPELDLDQSVLIGLRVGNITWEEPPSYETACGRLAFTPLWGFQSFGSLTAQSVSTCWNVTSPPNATHAYFEMVAALTFTKSGYEELVTAVRVREGAGMTSPVPAGHRMLIT